MSVHKKLMEARIRLQNTKLTKSGHNKFAGYTYFELGDFLPTVQQIFSELGIIGTISFLPDAQDAGGNKVLGGVAVLSICDVEAPDVVISFSCPLATANLKGCHDVQNLGASMTYIRRYLWVNALEIVEHDALDATTGSDKKNHVHKPADNPAFNPDEEEEIFLLSVVDDIVSLKDDPEAASEKLYGQNLDNDQILWIWNKLGPYPPLRTKIRAIKRLKDSKNEQV